MTNKIGVAEFVSITNNEDILELYYDSAYDDLLAHGYKDGDDITHKLALFNAKRMMNNNQTGDKNV